MNEDIPLAPITGWTASTIEAYGAVMLKLSYLLHPTQGLQEANETPHFALTLEQCRELSQTLQKAVQKLESGAPQGTGLPKH